MSDNTPNTDTVMSDSDIQSSLEDFFSSDSDSKVDSVQEQTRDDEYDDEEGNEHDDSDDSDDDGYDEDDDDSTDDDDDESDGSYDEEAFNDADFTITVDGEELTVKGNELKNGYMRQSSYTRKTQELANERKAVVEEKQKVAEQAGLVRFQAHSRLEQFEAAVNQAGGWERLRASHNPEEVEQFTRLYVGAQQEAAAADELINEYQTSIRQANVEEITNIFTDMSKTIEGFDGNTLNQMDSYLTENGFTNDMVMSITSRAAWDMIYKAMKYDEAQSRSKKADKSATKDKVEKKHHSVPAKSTKPPANKSRKLNKALERQKKSGGDARSTEEALIELLGG